MLKQLIPFSVPWMILTASLGCSSTTAEKSTGTNWVACDSDADCVVVAGATCSRDKWCVDARGNRVSRPSSTAGSGGASNEAGTSMSGGSGPEPPDGGRATGGRTSNVIDVDCYSPGQNLHLANFESGAVGCKCPTGAPGFCVDGVALVCENGRWVTVDDGPCFVECWTPSEPETAAAFPERGCACLVEYETRCLHTMTDGYMLATCVGGSWTLQKGVPACGCTHDEQCGFGSRCDNGACLPGICEVDGMRYAQGVNGIPDPFSCNKCQCEPQGLGCTRMECLEYPECPDGTVAATVCADCGPTGDCSLTRAGCLPRCESHDDCAGTSTFSCSSDVNACAASCY